MLFACESRGYGSCKASSFTTPKVEAEKCNKRSTETTLIDGGACRSVPRPSLWRMVPGSMPGKEGG